MTRALLATVLLFGISTVLHAQSPTLTNTDVIRIVAMHVSDQTVIAVIHEATATQFDLKTLVVDELAFHRISSAVIAAMRQSAAPTPANTIAAPAQSPRLARAQTLAEAWRRRKVSRTLWSGRRT